MIARTVIELVHDNGDTFLIASHEETVSVPWGDEQVDVIRDHLDMAGVVIERMAADQLARHAELREEAKANAPRMLES